MKQLLNKMIGYSFILGFAMLVLGLQSCKKTEGPPSIRSVRLLDPNKRDSLFTQTTVGNIIVINGSGFNGLTNIYFNGFDASFNSAINSDTTIVLRIPSDAPTAATDPNVPNTIKVVTTHGDATYSFKLLLPPPIIASVSNENPVAGTTITITGDKLYLTKIVFPGNKEVSTFTTNKDATQVSVVVPSGITTSGPLTLVGPFGTTSTIFAFATYTAPSTGFLANFEDGDSYFGWQWWGGNKTNSGFTNNTGNFIEINPSGTINAGDNSWYGNNRAVMVAAGPWMTASELSTASINNYALKFEINVKKPWTTGSLQIAANGNFNYMARYAPWEAASSGTYQTSGWETVTIPLTGFLKSGAPAATITTLTGGTNSATIQIMLYNDSTKPLADFDAAIDNVRIVKIK
jgi:hypothetical protein